MEILRNRINKSGLVEPEIAAEGPNRISIKIPVSTESQKKEYKKLIQMSAQLEFRLIAENDAKLFLNIMPTLNILSPRGIRENENGPIQQDW